MKVFWGRKCPKDSQFHCRSFSGKLFCSEIPERVELPLPQALKASKITFLPEKAEWVRMVEIALKKIESGEIEKIVLSRTAILELPYAPDPFAITASLQNKSKGASLFCIQKDNQAFLGASPEKLFSRNGFQVESEAVAGTRWELGQFSKKERLEISPVLTFLQTSLSKVCQNTPSADPLTIHSTHNLHHLKSTIRGTLRPHVTSEQIETLLHPTPALCGWPRLEALDLIRQLEPFDRGLYGGVVGWQHKDQAEMWVGIRSCWMEGTQVHLQTGAGIVKGSNPAFEWEELNQKLRLYEGILI